MAWYTTVILITFSAMIQVAWGTIFVINGNPIAWVYIMIWFLSSKFEKLEILTYAAFGGVVLDLLSQNRLGLYIIALVLSTGIGLLIEQKILSKGLASRILSFIAGLLIYSLIVSKFPL